MSRGPQADVITVKPTSNIYTALTAIGTLASLSALLAVLFRYNALYSAWPWG
jgi:hypothetical protein